MNSLQQNHILQQRLALTPTLKQSLSILSFNLTELNQFIQEQVESNPLLEISNDWSDISVYKDEYAYSSGSIQSVEVDESRVKAIDTIEQQLLAQVALQKINSKQKKLLTYLILNLNHYGYLDCDLHEVASQLCCSVDEVHKAVHVLQSFEPAGIGATSLSECLFLQLREYDSVPKYTEEILRNHLPLIASKELSAIAEMVGCSLEQVEEVLTFIQSLNPRPIHCPVEEVTEYIIPDIIVRIEEGELIVSINDQLIPELTINHFYQQLINENKEIKAYINQKYNEILLLKTGIEKRNVTLYKVAKAIVDVQSAFFLNDGEGLLPLRLRDISEIVGLHESTVWRTVNTKYIQTPKGTYPLKSLLVRGLLNEFGHNQNINVIKQSIKTLIEHENSLHPLSDSKIVKLLKGKGIKIARRTVAKYREQLNIPASNKRKGKMVGEDSLQ